MEYRDWEVVVSRFGTCLVRAKTKEDAMRVAEGLSPDLVSWSDDRIATDARETGCAD